MEISKETANQIKDEALVLAKNQGLNVAEDTAVALVKAAFKIIKVIVPKVNAMAGMIIVPAIELIEPKVLAVLDKIDGEDDAGY